MFQVEQIAIVSSSPEAIALDAHLGRLFLFQDVESEVTTGTQSAHGIVSAVVATNATIVFGKSGIEHLVEAVLNVPMFAFGKRELNLPR